MKYAVIITYSFDWDTPVFFFETFTEAKNFLLTSAEKEFNIDSKENNWNSELIFDNDNCYAKIINHFLDRDDITEMRIGDIRN